MTVNGPINPEELGNTLPHEHVLVDFIGADKVTADRYDQDSAYNKALPFLLRVTEFGCESFIDCTPAYLGRDPLLLKKLADATGLNIITNTGYYGARKESFYPAHVQTESAEQLSARWVNEFKNGIDGTGIRPGFMKLGSDRGPLTENQKKAVKAAALTHLETGLTVAIHSGDGAAAQEELNILMENGVGADAFIWVHAQNEKDSTMFSTMASAGVWVSLDGLSEGSKARYGRLLLYLKAAGLLNKVLLSHDAGWYNVGDPNGGTFNDFNFLFEDFVPYLNTLGFSDEEIEMLIRVNPMNAFTIRVRKG